MSNWAQGDADVGHSRLYAISLNLLALYSGSETLWGANVVADYQTSLSRHTHLGVHRKRWLKYLASGSTPTLYYGVNYAETESLSEDSGWQTADIAAYGIPIGGYYMLDNAYAAFETDNS
jgi:hypothetical protein